MRTIERERATQATAWLCVAAVHAGLLWLLVQPPGRGQADRGKQVRLRLVFLKPIGQPAPIEVASSPSLDTRAVPSRAVSRPAGVFAPSYQPQGPSPDSSFFIGRRTTETGTSVGSRTVSARLPDRILAQPTGATVRRRPRGCLPHAPTALAETGDGLHHPAFGDPGPPCPRIQANIPGLLAPPSGRERKLPDEELHRNRELCRP